MSLKYEDYIDIMSTVEVWGENVWSEKKPPIYLIIAYHYWMFNLLSAIGYLAVTSIVFTPGKSLRSSLEAGGTTNNIYKKLQSK